MTKANQAISLQPVIKLAKDAAAILLSGETDAITGKSDTASAHEARALVDMYYAMQEMRKRTANQILALDQGVDGGETHHCGDFMLAQIMMMEKNAEMFLQVFAQNHKMWPWFQACHGIGPVLSAGLIAHLGKRELPPTVGHWWRYGGLDPTQRWETKESLGKMWKEHQGDVDQRARTIAMIVGRDPNSVIKDATTNFKTGEPRKLTKATAIASLARIPFNRPLKTLLWKLGDQFVKLGGRQDAFYAVSYRNHKARLVAKNEGGGFKSLAEKTLAEKPGHANKDIYQQGKLPDGRIDLMARRKAVKLFLSHLHELWWQVEKNTMPPHPFALDRGHAHYIAPPHKDALGI